MKSPLCITRNVTLIERNSGFYDLTILFTTTQLPVVMRIATCPCVLVLDAVTEFIVRTFTLVAASRCVHVIAGCIATAVMLTITSVIVILVHNVRIVLIVKSVQDALKIVNIVRRGFKVLGG